MELPIVTKHDIIVDNSIFKDLGECEVRAALRHVLGLTTKGARIELRVGSDVHEALAVWLSSGGDAASALVRFDLRYKKWAQAHVDAVDAAGKPHRLGWAPVRRILAGWFETHPLKTWPWVVKPDEVEVALWGVLGVVTEAGRFVHGKVPGVGEGRVLMVALLDALAKNRTGGRVSVDHKTGGNLGQFWLDRQEDAPQFTGQMWLAREAKLVLSGIVINGIELGNLNSSDRTCGKHGMKYRECALEHLGHRTVPIMRASYEVVAWEAMAVALTKKFLRLRRTVETLEDVRELKLEGRFTGACHWCDFRPWCRLGRPLAGAKEFIEERWNPLEHAGRRGGPRA